MQDGGADSLSSQFGPVSVKRFRGTRNWQQPED